MTSNKEDNEKSYKIPVGKDINKVHDKILRALEYKLGAQLREQ